MKALGRFAALVFCVTGSCFAAEGLLMNYSLWPRRPEAIAKARSLIYQQKLDEALRELEPYIDKSDIGGVEARALTGQINLPRYLSLQNPHAKVYRIASGDHVARVAALNSTPQDLLYMLNGTTNPSNLKVGEKLIVAPMDLSVDIDVQGKELRLWDKKTLIASEPISEIASPPKYNGKMEVSQRYAYNEGVRVSSQSYAYTSSNRLLRLSDGSFIAGVEPVPSAATCYRLDQGTLNALALLINTRTEVRVLTGKNAPKVITSSSEPTKSDSATKKKSSSSKSSSSKKKS